MTNEQAIAVFKNMIRSNDEHGNTLLSIGEVQALDMAIKTLAEMDEQTERDWVSCEEVEPEEDQECWFTVNDRGFRYVNRGCFTRRYGERRDKGFITAGGFAWWNTAIAWMPIPEPDPYKGETE